MAGLPGPGSQTNEEEESGIAVSTQPDSSDSSSPYSAPSIEETCSAIGEDSPCYQGNPVSRSHTALVAELPDKGAVKKVPRTAPHKLETYDPAVHGEKEPARTGERSKTPSSSSLSSSLSTPSISSPPAAQSGACGGTFSESDSSDIIANNNIPSVDGGRGEADEGLTKSISTLEVKGTIKSGDTELSYEFKGDPADVHIQSERHLRLAQLLQQSPPSKPTLPESSSSASTQPDTDQPITMANISPDTTSDKNTKPNNYKK